LNSLLRLLFVVTLLVHRVISLITISLTRIRQNRSLHVEEDTQVLAGEAVEYGLKGISWVSVIHGVEE